MHTWEAKMTKAEERVSDRVVLHVSDGLRQVVDPADVYYLEAQNEDTLVRLRSEREQAPILIGSQFLVAA